MADAAARKRTRTTLNVTGEEFKRLGSATLNRVYTRGSSVILFERRWQSEFGVAVPVVVDCWNRLDIDVNDPDLNGIQPSHLLWTLLLLKKGGSNEGLSGKCGCDEQTFRKWTDVILLLIHGIKDDVVSALD